MKRQPLLGPLAFCVTVAVAACSPARDAVQPKRIQVNGAELNYIDVGTGDPVVFVHGSLGDFMTFSSQFDAFSRYFRVISYSRRFHPPNPSVPGDSVYSPSVHAEDLAAMIQALGFQNAHVVGLSYGAYTAVILALTHPSLVRSLVLAEPPLLPLLQNDPVGGAVAAAWDRDVHEATREAFRKGSLEDGMRVFVDALRARAGAFDEMSESERTEFMRYAPAMKVQVLTDPQEWLPKVTCQQLQDIHAPTLLVAGELSPRVFHLVMDALQRCVPNTERVNIANAGHNSQHSQRGNPEDFNQKVIEFLRQY